MICYSDGITMIMIVEVIIITIVIINMVIKMQIKKRLLWLQYDGGVQCENVDNGNNCDGKVAIVGSGVVVVKIVNFYYGLVIIRKVFKL